MDKAGIIGDILIPLNFSDVRTKFFDSTIKETEIFLDEVNRSLKVKKVALIASVAAYNTYFPLPARTKTKTRHQNHLSKPDGRARLKTTVSIRF
ncbi:hypothetical protein [Winogradskyella helgolandensis]|uniref:hypothetical protein n=1 Tax=Winogradskyella helgolandensis TaxID=2697010 RepID=UPI0015C6BE50|nr:hypothetical protein [Winogradskyella helgolandensis]